MVGERLSLSNHSGMQIGEHRFDLRQGNPEAVPVGLGKRRREIGNLHRAPGQCDVQDMCLVLELHVGCVKDLRRLFRHSRAEDLIALFGCASSTEASSASLTIESGLLIVRTKSWRRSATRQPSALVRPGRAGIRTLGMPSSRASAAAWSGPAPPNANRMKSRGSCPRERQRSNGAGHLVVRDRITAAADCSAPSFSAAPTLAINRRRIFHT